MKSEIRPVPGFEGRYSVTDAGVVISHLKRGHYNNQFSGTGRALKPYVRKDGYQSVMLTKPGIKTVSHLIHRIVAMAFRGEIQPREQVAHLDGNKGNNQVANIAIVTPSENNSHKRQHGTMRGGVFKGSTNWASKLTEESVLEIRRAYGAKEAIQSELAARFGVAQTVISAIVRRKRWAHI